MDTFHVLYQSAKSIRLFKKRFPFIKKTCIFYLTNSDYSATAF